MVNDIVHGEDNFEEKTREDADNRMYYLGLNLFNKDVICYCDGGWSEIFYAYNSKWLTTSTCELVVIDTVDREDNLEENTRETADMFDRMCFGLVEFFFN